jgi:hypothetical protein
MCPMIMFHTLSWKEFDNLDELTFEKMEVFLHGYRWDDNRNKNFIKIHDQQNVAQKQTYNPNK